MIGFIMNFWHSLPLFLRLPIDFFFAIIVVRGVVAKDITSWLEDKGFIKTREKSIVYRMLDYVYNTLLRFTIMARKIAIIQHYRLGHTEGQITTCSEGKCAIL